MAGYLIAEEGPLSGLVLDFSEGELWTVGRDIDEVDFVLEDPMVSRKHAICTLTSEGYVLENLSTVNPATHNGKVITDPVRLVEGDIVQIGSTFFRFSASYEPEEVAEEAPAPPIVEEGEDLSQISFDGEAPTRWMLKVVAGPNSGAEFALHKGRSYILGKDSLVCDLVFQDLSVSRQHARISVDEEENVTIEDLGSRNGVMLAGELIAEKRTITSQDLIGLGTTSLLVVDRLEMRETIISPSALVPAAERGEAPVAEMAVAEERVKPPRDWRELIIPTRYLVMAGLAAIGLIASFAALFALFKTEQIVVPPPKHESQIVQETIQAFPTIHFNFNANTGKLFLMGHVLTPVDKKELFYLLHTLPFITHIDDNVVVDEYVWQNMNALLITNPEWASVSIHSPAPGKFVMSGYLKTPQDAVALTDYLNINFPYLDELENLVVVEELLAAEIQTLLIEKGFSGVTFHLIDGELILSGRAEEQEEAGLEALAKDLQALRGVRVLKNFVILTTQFTSRIDISSHYHVTGYSRKDASSFYAVINGKILGIGEVIDGMTISHILPHMILLEKDGLKFRIDYNLQ